LCRYSAVWEGPGVVASARKMIGATNPLESEPGTIRGDLAVEVGRNVIHGEAWRFSGWHFSPRQNTFN
jgi:nucleoside diphosphate kinase